MSGPGPPVARPCTSAAARAAVWVASLVGTRTTVVTVKTVPAILSRRRVKAASKMNQASASYVYFIYLFDAFHTL